MKALPTALDLIYPLAIYLGLQIITPRWLAVLVALGVAARLAPRLRRASWPLLASAVPAAGLVMAALGVTALLDDARGLKLAPVAVNLGLLAAFARSLLYGPSLVEVLARLHYRTLPPDASDYCRRVTGAWCIFFALNAAFITWLALGASLAAWTLYTGLLAYLVVGLLLGLELVLRAWRFRHYEDGLADLVLRRIFPPRPTR